MITPLLTYEAQWIPNTFIPKTAWTILGLGCYKRKACSHAILKHSLVDQKYLTKYTLCLSDMYHRQKISLAHHLYILATAITVEKKITTSASGGLIYNKQDLYTRGETNSGIVIAQGSS